MFNNILLHITTSLCSRRDCVVCILNSFYCFHLQIALLRANIGKITFSLKNYHMSINLTYNWTMACLLLLEFNHYRLRSARHCKNRTTLDKKLSYRRESAHLTSPYHSVQKAFRFVEPFRRESRVRQTDRRTDGQIAVSNSSLSHSYRCAITLNRISFCKSKLISK